MEWLKNVGTKVFGFFIFFLISLIIIGFIKGIPWIAMYVLPITKTVTEWAIIASIIILPVAFIRKAKPAVSAWLLLSSFIFGIHLWLFSALIAYELWGFTGLIIGLILAGIGVLPIAILACLFNGMWSILGLLVGGIVLVYGTRLLSAYLAGKAEETAISVQEIK